MPEYALQTHGGDYSETIHVASPFEAALAHYDSEEYEHGTTILTVGEPHWCSVPTLGTFGEHFFDDLVLNKTVNPRPNVEFSAHELAAAPNLIQWQKLTGRPIGPLHDLGWRAIDWMVEQLDTVGLDDWEPSNLFSNVDETDLQRRLLAALDAWIAPRKHRTFEGDDDNQLTADAKALEAAFEVASKEWIAAHGVTCNFYLVGKEHDFRIADLALAAYVPGRYRYDDFFRDPMEFLTYTYNPEYDADCNTDAYVPNIGRHYPHRNSFLDAVEVYQ